MKNLIPRASFYMLAAGLIVGGFVGYTLEHSSRQKEVKELHARYAQYVPPGHMIHYVKSFVLTNRFAATPPVAAPLSP